MKEILFEKEQELRAKALIVSRHPATVEWIRKNHALWRNAPAIPAATPEQVVGKIVAGNLPLGLAVQAEEYWAVEFSGPAPRGTEFGLEEMERSGAHLVPYRITIYPFDEDGDYDTPSMQAAKAIGAARLAAALREIRERLDEIESV